MTEEIQQVEETVEATTTTEEIKPEVESQETDEQKAESPASDDAGAPRNKKGAERRIRQLTRKFRDSERLNQELMERLEAIESRVGPKPEPVRPKRDDFETQEDYEDELFAWRDAKQASPEPKESPAPVPEEQKQIVQAFEQELEELDPEAVFAVMEDDWPCNHDMTQYIMASDNRAELAFHLATNTEVAEKISKMPPILAARELAKVEDSLSSKNNQSTRETETLAPPITTGKPTGMNGITDPEKMSTKQWVEMRRKQLEERAP